MRLEFRRVLFRSKLNLSFQPSGSILLQKTSSLTGQPVAGAVYSLYAGQDLYSGGIRIYAKDEKVAEGTTNEKGEILFESLRLFPSVFLL